MLSISFLPWLLLLLGVVLSVPIVSYVENNRRKKAAEAAAAPPAGEEEALEEEVGFGEEDEFGESYGSEEVIAAEGDLGQVEGDDFDEKAFK